MNTTRTLLALAITSTLAACGGSSSNEAPKFSQTSYNFSTSEDLAVSGAVSATDNESVSYTVINASSNGVFALNADGSFTYTPSADFNGTDSATVQASDGDKTSQATINFTISGVNDAPVLTTTTFSVTTSAKTVATLAVTDVDNDDITFELVQAPENGTLALTADGEVTYQAEELSAISGSFVVSYTDGVIAEPIEATIDLKAAMVTNEDKLSYYYSSEKSHIAKAEAIKEGIADDVTQDNINIDLAASYYFAGFDDKAQAKISEISDVYTKAYAYRNSAQALDSRGFSDKAAQLRGFSEENYNLYLAEKGFENISKSDSEFFLGLTRDYQEVGQLDEANQLLTRVKLYANAVREEEYTSTYGSFLQSFSNSAEEAIETYQNAPIEANYQKAIDAIQHHADIAENVGYKIETSSGNFQGERSDRQRGVFLSYVITQFFTINAEEKAKEYMAKLLALYGEVAYDENYVYELGEYVDATRGHRTSYMFAVSELAGVFARYYPEAEVNIPIALVDTYGSSYYQSSARESLYTSNIINDVMAGEGINAGVSATFTYYTDDFYLRGIFDTLVESWSGAGAARQLDSLGYQESALAILDEVSDLITTDAYIDQQWSETYITGRSGCLRLTELKLDFGGDADAQATVCETLVNEKYSPESGQSTSDIISTHNHLLNSFGIVGNNDKVSSVADTMLLEIAKLEDIEDKAEEQLDLASNLLKYGLFDKSKVVLDLALTSLDTMIASDETALVEDALEYIEKYLLLNGRVSATSLGYDSYVYAVKAKVTSITDYATFYQSVVDSIDSRVTAITTKILTLSNEDIQDMMEDLVKINFYSGQTAKVTELIAHEANGDADKLSLNANLASYYTSMDDFPTTGVAAVDTDHDGLPNFFMVDVTDEAIEESGLTLDEDSDNDGIVDTEDDTPLGE
ncbi:MAG: cadherin-like domain-containing protein [Litorilituus sp.]|jgi:VCBS repeat-containing protein|nr:cadherin-like domain-containing protein [Litorilituus sp.]